MVMNDPPERPTEKPTCAASDATPILDAAVAGTAGLLTLLVFSAARNSDDGQDPTKIIVGGAATTAVFTVSSVVGFGRARRCAAATASWRNRPVPPPRQPVPFAPFVEAVTAKDPEAAQLTREAHDAAREGRCAPTAANGPRVNYLDAEYYDKVFLADDAIARCR
jgi:hypothetical protein